MQFVKIFCIILLVIYAVILFVFAYKSGRFFKTLLTSALIGVLTMLIVNISARFTGVSLPVNLYTVLSSSCLGLPGVLGLLTIRLFF